MYELWQAVLKFFARPVLGISAGHWTLFLVLTLVLYIVFRIVVRVVYRRLEKRAAETEHPYDDYIVHLLEHTRWFGVLGFAVFLALYFVALTGPYKIEETLRPLAMVLICLQVGWWGNSLIDTVLNKGFDTVQMSESSRKSASGVVRWFAMVILWGSIVLLILASLHVEITPLLAGLGVGGIAIAFALQQILGDIFCSVAIVLDKPFEVGDFIITGDFMGTVEHIGIKTTRVRSLGGEQIIFPNSDLIGSRIRNYKRMEQRRIVFGFGVTYSTPADHLEQIPDMVREIITTLEKTRFDRAHFKEFGDSALQFEVVYYVLAADYNLFMDTQQKINLQLLKRFEPLGIEMAFPSRTLYFDAESSQHVRPTITSQVQE